MHCFSPTRYNRTNRQISLKYRIIVHLRQDGTSAFQTARPLLECRRAPPLTPFYRGSLLNPEYKQSNKPIAGSRRGRLLISALWNTFITPIRLYIRYGDGERDSRSVLSFFRFSLGRRSANSSVGLFLRRARGCCPECVPKICTKQCNNQYLKLSPRFSIGLVFKSL